MMRYYIELNGGEGGDKWIEADSPDNALAIAKEFADGGDWNLSSSDLTVWVNVRVSVRDEDGDYEIVAEEPNHPIHPPEPECLDDEEHDWRTPHEIVGGIEENPGCWGHGGGVISSYVCMRCGCGLVEDGWAQNRENGMQGLFSKQYEEGRYTDAIEALVEATDAE